MYFKVETKKAPYTISFGTNLSPLPHLHTHLEMMYFLGGECQCCADDKQGMASEEGDIFLAFPNQIHHYHHSVKTPHYMLIFSPDICKEFMPIFKKGIPENPIIKNADPEKRIYSRMIDILKSRNSPYADIIARANVLLILTEIFSSIKLEEGHEYDESILKRIITFCYNNYKSEISLADLSAALGVSSYYISHIFNSKLGIGFKEYVNSLRIMEACELLKSSDKNITEIAYDVGFGTTRSFNRSFLSIMKLSPKEYLNNYHGRDENAVYKDEQSGQDEDSNTMCYRIY